MVNVINRHDSQQFKFFPFWLEILIIDYELVSGVGVVWIVFFSIEVARRS